MNIKLGKPTLPWPQTVAGLLAVSTLFAAFVGFLFDSAAVGLAGFGLAALVSVFVCLEFD